MHSRC